MPLLAGFRDLPLGYALRELWECVFAMAKHFFWRLFGCSCMSVLVLSSLSDTDARYVLFTAVEASTGPGTISGGSSTGSGPSAHPEAVDADSSASALPFFILLPARKNEDGASQEVSNSSNAQKGAPDSLMEESKIESSEDELSLKKDLKRLSELAHRACNTRKIYKIVNPDTGEVKCSTRGLVH